MGQIVKDAQNKRSTTYKLQLVSDRGEEIFWKVLMFLLSELINCEGYQAHLFIPLVRGDNAGVLRGCLAM